MDVLVVADGHYYQTPTGDVYADSVYDYNFYKRYLQAFDHVYAVVRAKQVTEMPKGRKKSSGEGVSFLLLPPYQGPYQYIARYYQIIRAVKEYCNNCDCAIFRIPAATSNIFCNQFLKTKKPFAVEVVIDPWENFGSRATGNKLMLLAVRHNWTNLVRRMCEKANGASYVTERYLQTLYPPRVTHDRCAFMASYSSVELPDGTFSKEREWKPGQKVFWISHASNDFNGYGKGHITLMKAVKIVRDKGYDVNIRFVGDGVKRHEFEGIAASLGIADNVEFTGRLANGSEVRNAIHNSDIFVLPTFAEGLPRVLLEAMAEGIPCLSSPICGIPEILDKDYLFDFDDAKGFAVGIEVFIKNPYLMTQVSKDNLETAKKFSSSKLDIRRKEFYRKLRECAEERGINR